MTVQLYTSYIQQIIVNPSYLSLLLHNNSEHIVIFVHAISKSDET